MSLKSIYNKLMILADTSSTNEKVELLAEFLEDPVFLKVIVYMYDESKQFKINQLPMVKSRSFDKVMFFGFLNTLANSKGATDLDKGHLAELGSVDSETRKVLHMIINKDAKCGFSHKTINKARKGTIFSMPYCRCSTDKQIGNIKYPAIAQEKADGAFCNLINSPEELHFTTRNGKPINQLDHLEKRIFKKSKNSQESYGVYHGELVVVKNGKRLDRKTSNGIITSCIHGTADPEDAKCITLQLWDCIPKLASFYNGFCNMPYDYRIKRVHKFVKQMKKKSLISLIDSKRVYSEAETRAFYRKMRKQGNEGAIVKNYCMIWKDHTSTNAIKLKNVSEGELRITGWKHGKKGTKYANVMGSVECESECGKVKVSISGWSDEEREWDWDKHIGSIISVLYESVISDKRKPGQYSLYLPRFDREGGFRFEKTVADTYEELRDR